MYALPILQMPVKISNVMYITIFLIILIVIFVCLMNTKTTKEKEEKSKKRKRRNEDSQDELLSFYALLALSNVARADSVVFGVAYARRKYV